MKSLMSIVVITLISAGCVSTNEGKEYELTLESCTAMNNDSSHHYWKQPIAVQGCQMLISEYELQEISKEK